MDVVRVSIKASGNEKIALMGNRDSGISSIMQGILGNLYTPIGKCLVVGSVGFMKYDKLLFLEGKTIKENILFGKEYKALDYSTILELLEISFDKLERKDEEIVMEEGCNFNKIQKAKILIARSLYSNSDMYLIEEIFEKLEVQERGRIFKKVILGHLHQKIVVFSSVKEEFLKYSDQILVVEKGKVKKRGTYS